MRKRILILTLLSIQIIILASAQQWIPVSGEWKLKGNTAAEYSDKGIGNNMPRVALVGNSNVDNTTIGVSVKTFDGVGDIYLIGRWQNSDNFYALRYSDPHYKLTLLKVVDGREHILAEQERSVKESPKVATLRLELIMAGDKISAVANDTKISAIAHNFNRGAAGVGVRFRQGEFSDFTIKPIASGVNYAPIKVLALPNTIFERGKDFTLDVSMQNTSNKSLDNLVFSYQLPNQKEQDIKLDTIASGKTSEVKIPVKGNDYRSGSYFIKYNVKLHDNIIANGEEFFQVYAPANAHRFEQILWDNIDDNELLKQLGFTTASTNFYFVSTFAKEGESYAQKVASWLKRSESRLAYGIGNFLKIDSQRFWNKEIHDNIFMKDSNNKNQLHGHICNNHPKFKEIRNHALEAIGSRIRNNQSIKYILYDSETENEERKLFQCTHPECLALAKKANFDAEKLKQNRQWSMVGSQLFSNPLRAGVQKDGIIPNNPEVFEYLKWWWLDGSGFVTNRAEMAQQMKKYLPNALSFHDPLLRSPTFLGRDRGMDFVSQWTYSNPSPLSIIENIDELRAAVAKNVKIVPDIQLFWYTNEVIGKLESAEELKRKAAEDDSVVEARDAIHFGRFVTISPDNLTQCVWLALSRPIDALMLDGGSGISDTPGTYAYTNTYTPKALESISKELVQPYGPMLKNMQKTPKTVAMLQSAYSSLYGRTGNYGNANKEFADWYNSTILAQLQVDIIWDESIDKLEDYSVLIIGDTKYLSRRVADRVKKFAKTGNLVIVDNKLVVDIPHAVKFDIQLTDKLSAVQQAAAWRKNATELKSILAKHKFQWTISSDDDNLVVSQRLGKGDQTIFLINDTRVAGDYVGQYGKILENLQPKSFKVKFAKSLVSDGRVLYDCLQRRELVLDKDNSANIFINAGKLIYVASSRIVGLDSELSANKVNRGDKVSLKINLRGEKPLTGTQAVKVTITDSLGVECDGSGYYYLTNGKFSLDIDTAKNDATGYWRVEVEDLIANYRSENSFVFK